MNKLIPIKKLFTVVYGVNLELNALEECDKNDKNSIRFISRTENNNGLSAYVKRNPKIIPNPKHTISVATSGSVLSSFYQDEEYYSGRDLYYLQPLEEMGREEMLFYAFCIRANKYKYSYGRGANRTLGGILVPSIKDLPNWVNKVPFPKMPNSNPSQRNNVTLEDRDWKWFKMVDIFPDSKLFKCKCSNASSLLTKGHDILYIGAKKTDNGFMEKVKMNEKLVSKGNGIVFIGDGQGSVGYATYQKDDFIGSSTLTVGYNENLNEFTGLFLVTILDLERYRYSFGRKFGKEQIKRAKIKLPATPDGKIDWNFMEYFMKSLPYSSNLKVNSGLSDLELVAKYEMGAIDLKQPIKKMLRTPSNSSVLKTKKKV